MQIKSNHPESFCNVCNSWVRSVVESVPIAGRGSTSVVYSATIFPAKHIRQGLAPEWPNIRCDPVLDDVVSFHCQVATAEHSENGALMPAANNTLAQERCRSTTPSLGRCGIYRQPESSMHHDYHKIDEMDPHSNFTYRYHRTAQREQRLTHEYACPT